MQSTGETKSFASSPFTACKTLLKRNKTIYWACTTQRGLTAVLKRRKLGVTQIKMTVSIIVAPLATLLGYRPEHKQGWHNNSIHAGRRPNCRMEGEVVGQTLTLLLPQLPDKHQHKNVWHHCVFHSLYWPQIPEGGGSPSCTIWAACNKNTLTK